jgi:hypothetical protein
VRNGYAVAYWRYSWRYAPVEIMAPSRGLGCGKGISNARKTGGASIDADASAAFIEFSTFLSAPPLALPARRERQAPAKKNALSALPKLAPSNGGPFRRERAAM